MVARYEDVARPLRFWGTQEAGAYEKMTSPTRWTHVGRREAGDVRAWVEQKVRRHLMRARGRRGFGWKRWSTAWIYRALGVFNDYRVQYQVRV